MLFLLYGVCVFSWVWLSQFVDKKEKIKAGSDWFFWLSFGLVGGAFSEESSCLRKFGFLVLSSLETTMASGEEKGSDFYAVMGLNKECTESELRNAYKKLALKWHPDRCSASGNSKSVEEAKKKFQTIQQAYSVLSDANKRFLYDMGVYDSDDDDNNGMGEFLNEMAAMMSQTKPNENGEESFEELQQLFEDMFQGDIGSSGSDSHTGAACSTSSTYVTYSETSGSNKRNSLEMNNRKAVGSSDFHASFQNFCLGVEQLQDMKGGGVGGREGSSRRRRGRKQKVSSGHDVSSNDFSSISA